MQLPDGALVLANQDKQKAVNQGLSHRFIPNREHKEEGEDINLENNLKSSLKQYSC